MKISEFITSQKTTKTALAKTVKVSPEYIIMIVSGHRRPSPEVALRIQEATGGAVTVMELLFPGQNNDGQQAGKDEAA